MVELSFNRKEVDFVKEFRMGRSRTRRDRRKRTRCIHMHTLSMSQPDFRDDVWIFRLDEDS
jgi:hypothetical protein